MSARALVFSYGLRPRSLGAHKIVVDFTERIMGKEYKVLVKKFDKMRRKRNYLIYGIGLVISKTEAKNAIKTAEEFIGEIKKRTQNKNPQEKII